MSVTGGFFNSVNGDRTYNADDLTNFFDGILDDGVFRGYDDSLQVTAGTGLNVTVGGGKAIAFGKYVKNTGNLTLSIDGGGSQPRYDAVVVGVDLEDRTANIYVKQGTPSSSPAYPTILNTENTKELCLAYIYVSAGATSITDSNITDKREDNTVCGYVKFSNISANLNVYRNNVTVNTAGTDNVPIGIDEFDADNDTLFVYQNGLLMVEVDEYMVNGTGSTASIDLANDIEGTNNNIFSFIVMKMTI